MMFWRFLPRFCHRSQEIQTFECMTDANKLVKVAYRSSYCASIDAGRVKDAEAGLFSERIRFSVSAQDIAPLYQARNSRLTAQLQPGALSNHRQLQRESDGHNSSQVSGSSWGQWAFALQWTSGASVILRFAFAEVLETYRARRSRISALANVSYDAFKFQFLQNFGDHEQGVLPPPQPLADDRSLQLPKVQNGRST